MAIAVVQLPPLQVALAERPLEPTQAAALVEVRVQQKLSLPDQCELTFARDPEAADGLSEAALGRPLVVSTPTGILFKGEVTALSYDYQPDRGDLLRLRAYSCLHRLQKRQAARVFTSLGLGGLACELVKDLPVTVQPPEDELVWDYIPQCGVTDLQLLNERARACGCYFVCRDDELTFLTLEGHGPERGLRLGGNLHRVRLELNGSTSCRRVSSHGWNPSKATAHAGEAQVARSGRQIRVVVGPDRVNGRAERGLFGQIVESDDAALALAQARLDHHAAEEVALWGVAEGDIALAPGRPVQITGVAAALAGRYILTEVTHRISTEEGYLCELSNQLDPLPAAAPAQPAALARVTSVDDPEQLGRVQVIFLTLQDLPSDWLQVVVPGAGAAKGLVVLPDVGDLVVVLCLNDLAHGVVLGGLFGPARPPDPGVASGQRRGFSFHTALGQAWEFNDAAPRACFRDGAGNTLEFTPGRARLHAATDLEISAPGKRITISARTIDFNEA